mgnify:FL=1
MSALILSVYRDQSKHWRWTIHDSINHKILGASSEGYRDRIDCVRNLRRITGLPFTVPRLVKIKMHQQEFSR